MRNSKRCAALVAVGLVCGWPVGPLPSAEPRYEIGGPLAGLRLPPYPTQHGEEPGYPGCLPELQQQGEIIADMGHEYREWGPQGQAPERDLYPGSVEHWRAYMFKYMPLRSFFDRQSQIRNFIAARLPGVDAACLEQYAEPVYWVPRHQEPRPTGKMNKPVPVVRMKTGSPLLDLDLGELDQGLYVVRVIGAVQTERLRPFREPLFMAMTVNDGLGGETSRYRLRLGYCDEFYSVAEFYFHAPQKRRYRAELAVDRGSTVELLVHNVSLDDVLSGTVRRALKTRRTLPGGPPPKAEASAVPLSRDERLEHDAAIWNGFPPLGAQASAIGAEVGGYGAIKGVRAGTDQLTGEEILTRFGQWLAPNKVRDLSGIETPAGEQLFLVNPELKLAYTVGDLCSGRPLPAPYPLPDDGAGLYFPDPDDPSSGAVWTPIGHRVHGVYQEYYRQVTAKLDAYKQRGGYDDAHDAAITLVRWAYAFPTLDFSEYLSNTVHDPGPFNRDLSCRRRASEANFLPHYQLYVDPIMYSYDELFELIRGNELLAESVGRFVPWVKTPEDVLRLVDVYLVQTTAKRILRYHYHTDPMDIANLAAVVGDRRITDPWMDWLFARTFIYPLPVAGIQDVMTSGTTREGTEVVGSTYYAQGEGALRVAASLDRYLAAGGNPKFDLSDQQRWPKPVAHAYWRLENVVAGGDFLRIGDVCGPDKAPGSTLRDLEFAHPGWRWTRDPRFAFILFHYVGRQDQSENEWAEIEVAAKRQPRAPWLEQRSRVMPMWAGVLETGHQHDDYRFRRAAYLRLGFGMGHHHYDSLDLQVVAHGLPMTIDGGQRPGYTTPGDRTTRAHNLVQVEGVQAYRHGWATALADCEGARYLAANAEPPEGVDLFRRQIALVDVDEGAGSQPLAPADQWPQAMRGSGGTLPSGVTTANSYVFDVFRSGGGQRHTYCFHGPLNDDFVWNAASAAPPAADSEEGQYLSRFSEMPELSLAGDAPDVLEATWRMALEVDGPGCGEKEMLRRNFDPDSPRKFTRLHLLGVGGARAMRGEIVCRQWRYHFTNLMVAKKAADERLDDAFVALVEPYAGSPFITSRRQLPIADNERDSRRAVAVEVSLRGGRTDICFADARPERDRSIPGAGLTVGGEFAFHSTDADGLRQAVLAGGRKLVSAEVRIAPAAAERRGRVVRVDYQKRKLWIDAAWPQRASAGVFEIGLPGHMTSCTATAAEPAPEGGTVLTLLRGGDYFRGPIEEFRDDNVVVTTLRPLVEHLDHNRGNWVASDDASRTFWRASYLGQGGFRLEGPPATREAFGEEGVLRLWEFGVGDDLRQSTSVALRRIAPGRFELTSDVDVALSLPARSIELIVDGKPREIAPARADSGWVALQLPPCHQAVELKVVR